MYTYNSIYIERERERCVYIYIYIYTHIHIRRQFRLSREGAVSYFVGGNDKYKEDKGFALKLWDEFQFRNFGLILTPDRAFAMGEYIFTAEGERTEAQYAFGFVRDRLGRLRIDLLHASYPSNGKAAWDGSKSRLVAAEGRLSEADVAEAQLEYARSEANKGTLTRRIIP